MSQYILALDPGTSSSRAIVFNQKGEICSTAQREFPQHFPKPGWVEHNPHEIWSSQASVIAEAITQIDITGLDIAGIGITNQRETTIVWDRDTEEPVYNAIVWQDRRTSEYCDQLKAKGKTVLGFAQYQPSISPLLSEFYGTLYVVKNGCVYIVHPETRGD